MAKRRCSSTQGIVKRYATYNAIRGPEKAVKGAGKAAWRAAKIFLTVCGFLLFVCLFIAALPVALVAAVVVIILVRRSIKRVVAGFAGQPAAPTDVLQRQTILREIKSMNDCLTLVNESANLSVVARRYKLLMEKLDFLAGYSPAELAGYGITTPTPFQQQKQTIEAKKVTLFNQAINRAYEKERQHIDSLKTEQGKENALLRFYDNTAKIIGENGIPSECFSHLESVCRTAAAQI